jgi:hypothetical protein
MTLCQCGCKQPTPIAKKTDARKGHVKGQGVSFVPGHFGRYLKDMPRGTAILQPQEITESRLIELRRDDDQVAAEVLQCRAKALEVATKRSFIEIGLICHEMRERGLWAKLSEGDSGVPFHSWEHWATDTFSVSARSAFAAVRIIDATKGNIPAETLKDMPRVNAQRLAGLSSRVQKNPKIIEAAINSTEKEFVALVQKSHPDQHVGKAPALVMNFNPEDRENFDDTIQAAMWVFEVESREDAITNILNSWKEADCEREGYHHATNVRAYEMAKKRDQR